MNIARYIELRDKAFSLVAQKSQGEMRHASAIENQPYWTHVLNVRTSLIQSGEKDYETLLAAILHDIVEDSNVTVKDIAREFTPHIAEIVALVTKPHDYTDADASAFYQSILQSGDTSAMKIKVFDRIDNLLTNMEFNQDKPKALAYLAEAREHFLQFASSVGLGEQLQRTITYMEEVLGV